MSSLSKHYDCQISIYKKSKYYHCVTSKRSWEIGWASPDLASGASTNIFLFFMLVPWLVKGVWQDGSKNQAPCGNLGSIQLHRFCSVQYKIVTSSSWTKSMSVPPVIWSGLIHCYWADSVTIDIVYTARSNMDGSKRTISVSAFPWCWPGSRNMLNWVEKSHRQGYIKRLHPIHYFSNLSPLPHSHFCRLHDIQTVELQTMLQKNRCLQTLIFVFLSLYPTQEQRVLSLWTTTRVKRIAVSRDLSHLRSSYVSIYLDFFADQKQQNLSGLHRTWLHWT